MSHVRSRLYKRGAAKVHHLRMIRCRAEGQVPRCPGIGDRSCAEHEFITVLSEFSGVDELCPRITAGRRDRTIENRVACSAIEVGEFNAGAIVEESGIESDFGLVTTLGAEIGVTA